MAQTRAVSNPPAWISKCAGVQKLSRPMVSCQEMSQYKPMAIRMDALVQAHTVHGTRLPATSDTDFDAEIGAEKLPAEVLIDTASNSSVQGSLEYKDTLNGDSFGGHSFPRKLRVQMNGALGGRIFQKRRHQFRVHVFSDFLELASGQADNKAVTIVIRIA